MKGLLEIKATCHHILGKYLVERYMSHTPRHYTLAFLAGCVEPDKNPATYLKGSLRSQWLRGHNWGNAQRYIHRVCRRLEAKQELGLLDYYRLGKLMHYTTDAFTYAHNDFFTDKLQAHRNYEARLQSFFTRYLHKIPHAPLPPYNTAIETIRSYHREYTEKSRSFHTDCRYCVNVCSSVLTLLLPPKYYPIPSPGQ